MYFPISLTFEQARTTSLPFHCFLIIIQCKNFYSTSNCQMQSLERKETILNRTFNFIYFKGSSGYYKRMGKYKFFKPWQLGKAFFSDSYCRQNQQKSTLECSHNKQSCCIFSHAGRDTCHTWREVFEQEEQNRVHWKIKRKPCHKCGLL